MGSGFADGNLADQIMWRVRPKPYNWEDLTLAWNELQKVEHLRRQRIPIGTVGAARTDLEIVSMDPEFSEITEEDIQNFKHHLESAREDLHLHYNFLANPFLLRHDSSVEDVMKLMPKYKFINACCIPLMVQDVIDKAKNWFYVIERSREYALFLPTREFIERTTPLKEALEKLKTDSFFTESTFNDLPDDLLEEKLRIYLRYLNSDMAQDAKSSYERAINEDHEILRKDYLKKMNHLREEFITPAHFLIHQERFMGYAIRNPIEEITKLRVYFGDYAAGVPPFWLSCWSWRGLRLRTRRF